jgi:hypothetical protein
MLTQAEKMAGRHFRAHMQLMLDGLWSTDPAVFEVPHYLAVIRHICPEQGWISSALACREFYQLCGAYPELEVEAGRFAFIWREGKCRHCGATGRSRTGWLVDTTVRPPLINTVTI